MLELAQGPLQGQTSAFPPDAYVGETPPGSLGPMVLSLTSLQGSLSVDGYPVL